MSSSLMCMEESFSVDGVCLFLVPAKEIMFTDSGCFEKVYRLNGSVSELVSIKEISFAEFTRRYNLYMDRLQ